MITNSLKSVEGKIILRYLCSNNLLEAHPDEMKQIYLQPSLEIRPDLIENLVIETTLFDGLSVCFSLISGHLYHHSLINNEMVWVRFNNAVEGDEEDLENNFGSYYNADLDKEQAVFEGSISFIKDISPEFKSFERYEFIMLFNHSKEIRELLDKYEPRYTFHA